jgi:hypothetical protein
MMELLGYKRVQQRRSWDEAIDQLMSSMEKFRRALEQRYKSVSCDTIEANFKGEDPDSSELVHREIESMELEKVDTRRIQEARKCILASSRIARNNSDRSRSLITERRNSFKG